MKPDAAASVVIVSLVAACGASEAQREHRRADLGHRVAEVVGVRNEHDDERRAEQDDPDHELREHGYRSDRREHGVLGLVGTSKSGDREEDPARRPVDRDGEAARAPERPGDDEGEDDERPRRDEEHDPEEPPQPRRHDAILTQSIP